MHKTSDATLSSLYVEWMKEKKWRQREYFRVMFNTLAKWKHQCRAPNKDIFDYNHTYLSVTRRKCVSETYTSAYSNSDSASDDVKFLKEIEVEKMPTMPLQSKIDGVSIRKVFLPFRFMRPATNVANTRKHIIMMEKKKNNKMARVIALVSALSIYSLILSTLTLAWQTGKQATHTHFTRQFEQNAFLR